MGWVDEFFEDPVYDLEYLSHPGLEEISKREAEFLVRELKLGKSSRVLDLACGVGRHALIVARHAGSVVGYDKTGRFIARAVKSADELGLANVEFVTGDMRRLSYSSEFDAVYSYFTSWGYYSDEENFDVLVRICKALEPGGLFLLETVNRDAVMAHWRPREWRELDNGIIMVQENSFDYKTGRHHSKRTYIGPEGRKTFEIDHLFATPDAIAAMFCNAGFKEIKLISAPDGEELKIESPRAAIIGRKSG